MKNEKFDNKCRLVNLLKKTKSLTEFFFFFLIRHPKKSILISLLISLVIIFFSPDRVPNKEKVLRHLDNITVLVDATTEEGKGGLGTGTLFSRKDEKGNIVHFVWTAAHVVSSLENPPDENLYITFKDLKVMKINLVGDTRIEKVSYDAKVIKFSMSDDLAVLEITERNLFKDSVSFSGPEMVNPGRFLYHIGCLFGEQGYNSLSEGIMSANGRIHNRKVFDQTSTVVFPGSSGGGVFNESGEYIGMVTLMRQANMNYIIPMRRIINWAVENHVDWALSDSVLMPKEYVRHNLYKDSDLDSDVEFLSFRAREANSQLQQQLLIQDSEIKKLKELLDNTRKELRLTNSPIVHTNLIDPNNFIFRFFSKE